MRTRFGAKMTVIYLAFTVVAVFYVLNKIECNINPLWLDWSAFEMVRQYGLKR